MFPEFPINDDIGDKLPGELIRSQDWNLLVKAVDALAAKSEIEITALKTTVGQLQNEVNSLAEFRDLMLKQFLRVSLKTTSATYALGQYATIVAQLTDLFGRPIRSRPWVDFVATWGQFRAVPGFEIRSGVGQRAIAVRADANGEVRVRLNAEHVNQLEDDDEKAIDGMWSSSFAGTTLANAVLAAETPANAADAYQAISVQYDNVQGVKNYTDNYVLSSEYKYFAFDLSAATKAINATKLSRWNEYRATVLAFLRDDSDPVSADPGLGYSSIQIAFRDWVIPWLTFDYLNLSKSEGLVREYTRAFEEMIDFDIPKSLTVTKDFISKNVPGKEKGIFSRQKHYRTTTEALNKVARNTPAELEVVGTLQNAISFQQGFETIYAGSVDTGAGLDVVVKTKADARGSLGPLTAELGNLKAAFDRSETQRLALTKQVTDMERVVNVQGQDIQRMAAEDGLLGNVRKQLEVHEGQIARFKNINAEQIMERTGRMVGLEKDLHDAQVEIQRLKQR
jgi:hypothetical protein